MLRLDFISCFLTIASTVLIGRRMWFGWIVAGANSVIICAIGIRTGQIGFVPANLFCLALYAYNIFQWRVPVPVATVSNQTNLTVRELRRHAPRVTPQRKRYNDQDALSLRKRDRVHRGGVPHP